jgi:hypothetical protein
MVWMHRSFSNLTAFGATGLKYTPGWAVGGWFVPFLNLVRPKQVMNELWLASGPDWRPGTDEWRRPRPATVLGWWWGLWIGTWLINRVAGSNFEKTPDPDEAMTGLRFGIVGQLALIATAALAIAVVGEVIDRQRQRREALLRAPTAGSGLPRGPSGRREHPRGSVLAASTAILLIGGVAVTAGLIATGRILGDDLATRPADNRPGAGRPDSGVDGSANERVHLLDLEAGQCVHPLPDSGELVVSVPVVGCDRRHDAEVFGVHRIEEPRDAPYPGDRGIARLAEEHCALLFTDYIGAETEQPDLGLFYFAPSPQTWAFNDRDIVCLAFHPTGPRTGSIEGSAD